MEVIVNIVSFFMKEIIIVLNCSFNLAICPLGCLNGGNCVNYLHSLGIVNMYSIYFRLHLRIVRV